MKQILKYGLGCLLMTAVAANFSACSDDDEASQLTSVIYPGAVDMQLPEAQQLLVYKEEGTGADILPLVKGESVKLNYVMTPEDATSKEVKWTSSNDKVATVAEDGTITAVSGGDTGFSIIQIAPAIGYSGSNIASTLKVVVVDEIVPTTSLAVSSAADVTSVYAGENIQLSVVILPAEATYKTVKWTSSNEGVATVDNTGLVTGVANDAESAAVTITATSLDGAGVVASKELTVNKATRPTDVVIDQKNSVDNGYLCAIADKTLALTYTTTPADCTKSLIQWTSSDETIATVKEGVVTFNQEGVFGKITITAFCKDTGKSSSINLSLEAGLVRELFHDKNNYGWYNAAQSGNGTKSSHVWSDGKVTVTTYTQNATKQRGDFKCWNPKTWLHAGNYPIIAIRMQDVKGLYPEVTGRNITLDASGTCGGASFSGGLGGNNNQWLHDYKCSDGSHVFIYDLTKQKWATGGILPTSSVAEFATLQFKYADIATLTKQVTYDVYWIQTFKTLEDVQNYVKSEGLTYDAIK